MTPAERPIASGVYWFAVKPNGCPEMGYAKPGVPLPEQAGWWAKLGDREWTRVPTDTSEEQTVAEPNAKDWPSIADAKGLAYQYRRRGVMVLSFSGEGQAGGATYGMTRRDCDAMGKFLDRVMELIADGTLPRPW